MAHITVSKEMAQRYPALTARVGEAITDEEFRTVQRNAGDIEFVGDFSVRHRRVTIGPEQLSALEGSEPVEVIESYGAGNVIIVEEVVASLKYGTTPYNESSVDLNYHEVSSLLTQAISGLLSSEQDAIGSDRPGAIVVNGTEVYAGKAVDLVLSDAAGDGDGTLVLDIFYRVIPVD